MSVWNEWMNLYSGFVQNYLMGVVFIVVVVYYKDAVREHEKGCDFVDAGVFSTGVYIS